jgi:hypothetical protein
MGKPENSRGKNYLLMFLGYANLLVMTIAAVAIGRSVLNTGAAPFLPAFLFGYMVVYCSMPLLVAVHEFGHATVAAAMGWRVAMIAAGPFALKFHPVRISLGTPALGSNLSGGTWPVPIAKGNWRWKWVAMSASGAMANFAIGATMFGISLAFTSHPIAKSICLSLGAISLVMGMTALVPFNGRSGLRSDGGSILDIVRGQDVRSRELSLKLFTQTNGGGRRRDWDIRAIKELEDLAAKSEKGWEYLFLFSYYLDCGDAKRARAALDRAIERYGTSADLAVENAFLSVFLENDIPRARLAFEGVKSWRLKRTARYFMTLALLSLAADDKQDAERGIWRARRALRKWPMTTEDDWDMLHAIETRIEKSSTAPLDVLPTIGRANT